ncbi:MAG: hypothetical protein JRN68_00975 [Nitrososphaerota archaeon]|nr:hypothetical protein [Nitrososphaerota archaeon]
MRAQEPKKAVSAFEAGRVIANLAHVIKYRSEINKLAQDAEDPQAFLEAVRGFVEDTRLLERWHNQSEQVKPLTVDTKDPVSELYDCAAAASLNGNEGLANNLRDIAESVAREREDRVFAAIVVGNRAKNDLTYCFSSVDPKFARGELYAIGKVLLSIGESRTKEYLDTNHLKSNMVLALEFIRQGLGDDFLTVEKLKAAGYDEDPYHEKCKLDGTELLRRVKSYPPDGDSAYEQKVCPACNGRRAARI